MHALPRGDGAGSCDTAQTEIHPHVVRRGRRQSADVRLQPAGDIDQLCRVDRHLFDCGRDHAVFRSALSGADGQIIRTSVYAGANK